MGGIDSGEMEIPIACDEEAPGPWDSLLDFSIEDDGSLILSWPDATPDEDRLISSPPISPRGPGQLPVLAEAETPAVGEGGSKVRKRDPRLVCENFLAGRVPCACPEMDELQLEEEEEEVAEVVVGRRKRARAGGAGTGAVSGGARCQVPGCEIDIRELKGYHRRHRVCLRCANAVSVVLDGEHKRYCQQCGKFHVLSDFDEGKRSCRRKLERHNKRRRRRPTDRRSRGDKEREAQDDFGQEVSCEGEPRKEIVSEFASEVVDVAVSNKASTETLLEPEDYHGSPICSLPNMQNAQSKSITSFAASGVTHLDERMDNSKSALSSSFCDNKSSYSSVCPTGRISFKLYDWNPAEFPRRLRHQIFQWLASMPVELEGYIRPGCTILTVFIAMPQFMWDKLSQDAALFIGDLLNTPECLLRERGNVLIYLSSKIMQVMKDGTSLMNIKMEVQAPKLHYVCPTYFQSGKPMEFVVCGSNLDQAKFRLLVSFAGKYLAYDSCHAISHVKARLCDGNKLHSLHNNEHEMLRIRIPQTDSGVCGPAFIEVDNVSGISNFIPVFLGCDVICSELEQIQETLGLSSNVADISQLLATTECPSFCEFLVSKQTAMSELLLDIAWLLKEPTKEKNETALSPSNIQRITCLLAYLIRIDSIIILRKILHCLDDLISRELSDKPQNDGSDEDLILFLKHVEHGREVAHQRTQQDVQSTSIMPFTKQGEGMRNIDILDPVAPAYQESGENSPLVAKEITHRHYCSPYLDVKLPLESWTDILPVTFTSTRLSVFVMVTVVMCFCACIVLLHPRKAENFAITIRRRLSSGSTS